MKAHRQKKYLLIVDYNLARVKDVTMMSQYAQEKYGLETILIRPKPTNSDFLLAKHVLDLDPRSSDFIEKAVNNLASKRDAIVAVLPFSDNAVQAGALLAKTLGKKADSSDLAEAAYSKIAYREREHGLKEYLNGQNIFVPEFSEIRNPEEMKRFWEKCPGGFVVKPSCEGNNRGVIRIESNEDFRKTFDEVKSYIDNGLLCEELIRFSEEYSYDGIGHLSFITEKESISSRYPVEKGQIVPARVPSRQANSIRAAGAAANLIVGQRMGPFHNEIKYDPKSTRSAVIEPNRRPAGMKIWHLAEKVYGINFFKAWIDQLVEGTLPPSLPVPNGVAAIRQLAAPRNGRLAFDTANAAKQEQIFNQILLSRELRSVSTLGTIEWFGFQITGNQDRQVSCVPKDNADFIGEICMYTTDNSLPVHLIMDVFEESWKKIFSRFIETPSNLEVAI